MGQCYEVAFLEDSWHPFLGSLRNHKEHGKNLLELQVPVVNEDQYLSWRKHINKLQFNYQLRDVLYLPSQEIFISPGNFCTETPFIKLTFQAYIETLQETVERYKKQYNRAQLSEPFIWNVIFVLIKYMRYCQRNTKNHSKAYLIDISLQNLLICQNQTNKCIRVIKRDLFLRKKDLYSITLSEMETSKQFLPPNRIIMKESGEGKQQSEVYCIGCMMMVLCTLVDEEYLFGKISECSGAWIESNVIEQLLKQCQHKYSNFLIQTLNEMLAKQKQKRINLEQLYKRLEPFELEILNRKSFGVEFGKELHLMNGTTSEKTSFYENNRTLNNNSTNLALKVSEIKEENFHLADAIQQSNSFINRSKLQNNSINIL